MFLGAQIPYVPSPLSPVPQPASPGPINDLQGKSYTSKREGRKGGQFKEQGEEEEEKGKKHNTM